MPVWHLGAWKVSGVCWSLLHGASLETPVLVSPREGKATLSKATWGAGGEMIFLLTKALYLTAA